MKSMDGTDILETWKPIRGLAAFRNTTYALHLCQHTHTRTHSQTGLPNISIL